MINLQHIYLRSGYFAETENFFAENTVNKSKNQLKQYSETYEQYQKVQWGP